MGWEGGRAGLETKLALLWGMAALMVPDNLFGSKIQRCTSLNNINDFRTATLPAGVMSLFSHILNNNFTSDSFSSFTFL